jgi:competence protein ComEC
MRTRWRFVLCLCAALVLAGSALASAERVDGTLKIYVLDVGQGDAILVVCPKGQHRLLIDTGARGYPGSQQAFRTQLASLLGTNPRLDVVVSTHPHEDHIGSLEWVLSTFKVRTFVDSGRPYTTSFAGIERLAKSKQRAGQLEYFRATKSPAAHLVDFCPASNVSAQLLIPDGFGHESNLNNDSVVVLVTYNDQHFLFTGDAEKKEEGLLLADPVTSRHVRQVQLYKVGHHGAATSTTESLLQVMQPAVAVISSGCPEVAKNAGYRHPRAVTLANLNSVVPTNARGERVVRAGLPEKGEWTNTKVHDGIYVTARDGSVLVETDGSGDLSATFPSIPGALEKCGS